VLGNSAIDRNRAKRRVQEACRAVLLEEWKLEKEGKKHMLPLKCDILCVIYPGCLVVTFDVLKQQWREIFRNIQRRLLNKQPQEYYIRVN
jgi:RNase P protein component